MEVSIRLPFPLKEPLVRIDTGAKSNVPAIGVEINSELAKLIELLKVLFPITTFANFEFGLGIVGISVFKKELSKKTLFAPLDALVVDPLITNDASGLSGCKVKIPEPPKPIFGNAVLSLVKVRFPVPLSIVKVPLGG